MAHIPKKFKPRGANHINKDDIVLVTDRVFESNKCDVIYIYRSSEAKKLHKLGHISAKLIGDVTEFDDDDDDTVKFEANNSAEENLSESDSKSDDEGKSKKKINKQPDRDFDISKLIDDL